ncbi:hypothetical protein C8D92_107141 [Tamilnaduibacter salinus]|uniref:Polymerase/histidinol phosphatase N-terminal domain-containing protein n=1 Tax=Tamilnaduibacter salinus TaxID=1484056 RepID=A0A2U1CV98_9GAMM|nr:PHP domain-containing protein [Tamilnaduibacter salinus]PVY75420.1 hypothetical protein C8D92_107141 [Tamilnaduibacter salinus]
MSLAAFPIDLHCHSLASDGSLAPSEVVARAAEKGVTTLALTDHDTTDGVSEAAEAARQSGVTLLPGIELSCQWRRRTVHIVGLGFDPADADWQEALAGQLANRWKRARQIAERLTPLRVESLLEKATEQAGGRVPGRPHFARVLVHEGVVKDMNQAFQRHLGNGKRGDVKACWPELATVVDWIRAAGGKAVVAHPRKYGLTATKLRELLDDFQAAGGEAMEVLTSGQSDGDLGFLADLCRKRLLLASCGSDFHHPGRPWCELGRLPGRPPKDLAMVWDYLG